MSGALPEYGVRPEYYGKIKLVRWPQGDYLNYGDNTINESRDITALVSSFSLDLTMQRPWETLQLELVAGVGGRGAGNRDAPRPGDWLALFSARAKTGSNEDLSAVFFGYVTDVKASVTAGPDGTKDFQRFSVTATSWFDVLGRNQVFVAPQARQTVGTFFARANTASTLKVSTVGGGRQEQLSSWQELLKALLAGLETQNPSPGSLGRSLARAWITLGAVRVPRDLGSVERIRGGKLRDIAARLGDLIPVVYNDETRKQYAPRMTVDPIPGWSLEGLKSLYPQGQTTLDLLLGTYMADQNMVEFFPTLEPFDQATSLDNDLGLTPEATKAFYARQFPDDDSASSKLRQLNRTVSLDGAIIKKGTKVDIIDFDEEGGPPGSGVGAALASLSQPGQAASRLGEVLGVNPILVYRMRPWRTEELDDYQRNVNGPVQLDAKIGAVPDFQSIDTNIFRGITWNRRQNGKIVHGFSYPATQVQSFDYAYSDNDHINCVSVGMPNQPNSPIRFLEQASLPIRAAFAIEVSGLRHYTPRWPFWPPFDKKNDITPEQTGQTIIAGPKTQVTEKGVGFLTQLYTVALQAMQFMGAADRFMKGSITLATFRPELRPGMTAEVDVGDYTGPEYPTLTCYVEGVSHRLTVEAATGAIQAKTTVQFTRGAVTPELYIMQFQNLGQDRVDSLVNALGPERDRRSLNIKLQEGTPITFDPSKAGKK